MYLIVEEKRGEEDPRFKAVRSGARRCLPNGLPSCGSGIGSFDEVNRLSATQATTGIVIGFVARLLKIHESTSNQC